MSYKLPFWVVLWLTLSSILCTIDAFFVILRPRTLPGGDLNYLVRQYNLYMKVDTRYGDLEDSFNIGQSWMNLFEVVLNTVTLFLHFRSSVLSCVLALVVCSMTWAKTVLYFLLSTELCGGAHFLAHNTWQQFVLLYIIPNGFWLVLPLLCMIALCRELVQSLEANYQMIGKKKK